MWCLSCQSSGRADCSSASTQPSSPWLGSQPRITGWLVEIHLANRSRRHRATVLWQPQFADASVPVSKRRLRLCIRTSSTGTRSVFGSRLLNRAAHPAGSRRRNGCELAACLTRSPRVVKTAIKHRRTTKFTSGLVMPSPRMSTSAALKLGMAILPGMEALVKLDCLLQTMWYDVVPACQVHASQVCRSVRHRTCGSGYAAAVEGAKPRPQTLWSDVVF
ncbi:hypothetical protein BDV96DRAFT_171746 [Lophiotrema nucula]|uniref:Uncharacterized protein n=1 Tax=Lophiotrema nucula TaxID=690887 RepID=A0A6A5YYG3_9PLEO|nr:hypothetical protein BDV96DRAFT_171746 [Lophiotrema nucula]